jgi:hypothetical protein
LVTPCRMISSDISGRSMRGGQEHYPAHAELNRIGIDFQFASPNMCSISTERGMTPSQWRILFENHSGYIYTDNWASAITVKHGGS